MTNPLRDYLTIRQLSARLGVSRQRAHQLIKRLADRQVVRSPVGVFVSRDGAIILEARNRRPGRPARTTQSTT